MSKRQWYIDPDDDEILCPKCHRSLRRVPPTGVQDGRSMFYLLCPVCHPAPEERR